MKLRHPVRPLRDTLAVKERYGGAGILVQNSYGHCSLTGPSLCTAKHVRAYMERGSLATVCEPSLEVPFVGRMNDTQARSADDERLCRMLSLYSVHDVVEEPKGGA